MKSSNRSEKDQLTQQKKQLRENNYAEISKRKVDMHAQIVKYTESDIDEVILVGGSTRIPYIQELVT